MKIAGVCLLALTIALTYATPKMEVGKTYLYGYKAYTVSGVPLLNNERTGIAIWSDVLITYDSESRLAMRLQKPTIRQIYLNTDSTLPVDKVPHLEAAMENQEEFLELPQHMQTELNKFVEKPVQLVLKKGEIADILADVKEPEWILTLKSGIFHQFNLPKMSSDVMTTTEDTLVGEKCKIAYDVMKPRIDSENVLITRKFSLDSCKTPIVHDDLFKFANEPKKDSGDNNLRSSFVTIYNVTKADRRPFVNDWISEGRYTLSIFKPKHGEATIYTRQQMRFVQETNDRVHEYGMKVTTRRKSITAPMTIDKTKSQTHMPETAKLELIKSLLTEVINTVENRNQPTFEIEMAEKYTLAVDLMNQLEESRSFKVIAEMATQKQNKIMRQMIIQALSNCHSKALSASLKSIKSMLNTSEMTTIIAGLGVNGIATPELLRDLKAVLVQTKDDAIKDQTLLAIGSQIFQLCRPRRVYGLRAIKTNPLCTDMLKDEYTNLFSSETHHATQTRRLIVAKAIGNSGLDMSEILSEIIGATSNTMELRVNAVFAFRRNLDVQLVERHLLPLFRQFSEPVELRIAAFNTLIDVDPTDRMLVSLVSHLNMEPSMQLGNYIYSYLDSLVQMPMILSSSKNLTFAAQTLLPTVRRFEGGVWYSQNRQFFFSNLGQRIFQQLELSSIITPEQALPRSFLMKMTREYCGYFLNMFELGLRMEGADTYMQQLFAKMTTPEMMEMYSPHTRTFMREFMKLHEIIRTDDIKFRNIEKPEGHIFYKVLGNELGLYRVDQNTLSELTNTVFTELITLGENRIFNMQSLFPVQLRAQTPMGVMMFSDIQLLAMTSIHTDDAIKTSKGSIWAKDITLRSLLKSRTMFGVNMGSLDTAIGLCKHIKIILPHTWELNIDSQNGAFVAEVFWNVEDSMYKTKTPQNFELVQIAEAPINYFLSIDSDKKRVDLHFGKVLLHPLLKVSEEKYNFDFVGHNLTSIQHVKDATLLEPAYPYDGRHLITLSFYDNKVKPFGLKVHVNTDDLLSLNVTLNPRVPKEMKKLDLAFALDTNTDSNNEERIVLTTDVALKNGTYRFFLTSQKLNGQSYPILSWLDAGENIDKEFVFALQYGWNQEYSMKNQDVVLKYKLGKSDLQKWFEEEDLKLVGSECFKCENIKHKTAVWTNLFCERCMLKRRTTSRNEYTLFANTKKDGVKYVEEIFSFLDRMHGEFLNNFESDFDTEESITPQLISEESELIKDFMGDVDVDNLRAFLRIEDIHPYYTEMNVTTERGNKRLRYTHVPYVPAERRLDNLPLHRVTDVWMQREGLETRAVCHVDSTNMVKTMDQVIYTIPNDTKQCERILAKDCTKDNTFTISIETDQQNTRVLNVKAGLQTVKVTPITDGTFEVKVDSTVVPMTNAENIEEVLEKTFETEDQLISGSILRINTPTGKIVRELHLDLNEISTKIILVEDYVKIQVPFWYKNKMCGLCGDFNTERIMEFKLPNQTVSHDMESFLTAYSSDQCVNTL